MSKQDYIQLRTLTDQFYADNKGLQEALEGSNDGKVRGYGIVVIDLNGLVFGIPLRSHLNHKFGFVSERSEGVKKGLDYTKASMYREPIRYQLLNLPISMITKKKYKKISTNS